jgi:hypothetical protein
MKGEFYKMEYEAWDEGTDSLSLELEAAYLRLCHQMYRRHGAIPDQANTLCRIWRCHPNKATRLLAGLIAAGKVIRFGGMLSNARVCGELKRRAELSNKRADAGQKGGRSRPGGGGVNPTQPPQPDDNLASCTAQKSAKPLETQEQDEAKNAYKRREEKRREDTLEADASNAADAAQRPSDPVELLWKDGPGILVKLGAPDLPLDKARACIGRWLRDHHGNADLILGAIYRARDHSTRDPIPLVSRILKPVAASPLAVVNGTGGPKKRDMSDVLAEIKERNPYFARRG